MEDLLKIKNEAPTNPEIIETILAHGIYRGNDVLNSSRCNRSERSQKLKYVPWVFLILIVQNELSILYFSLFKQLPIINSLQISVMMPVTTVRWMLRDLTDL